MRIPTKRVREGERRTEMHQILMPPSLKRDIEDHVMCQPVRSINEWFLQLAEKALAEHGRAKEEAPTQAA